MPIENIIIAHLYQVATAATNRIIAYAKSFKKLGKEVTLVLGCDEVMPLPELEGIKLIGITASQHALLGPRMASVIKKSYTKDSAILVYGSPLLCLFLPKSRYNIFFECTEVPLYGKTKGLAPRIKEGIKIFMAKRASGMMVISKALKEYFGHLGIKDIEIVNMFVDVTRFDIPVQEIAQKYIAYCGTVSPFKDGVDCLIKAYAIFYKLHPEYRLKIIGRFENSESEKIVRQLAGELGLNEHIDFTGMVTSAEIPRLLKDAAMLALARPNNRQAQFGFPTKLGEYLATGNPVVLTQVGEIGDFLQDGVNCRMAVPGIVEDFADQMVWVADHPDEAKAIGIKGKELTGKEFSALEQSRKVLEFMFATTQNRF